jgi:hypothetical protein
MGIFPHLPFACRGRRRVGERREGGGEKRWRGLEEIKQGRRKGEHGAMVEDHCGSRHVRALLQSEDDNERRGSKGYAGQARGERELGCGAGLGH